MEIEAIKKKFYREIKLTKIRIVEKSQKLSIDDINSLSYTLNPHNRAEEEIKENYMGFITQRVLEGYNIELAKKMAKICVDEAIDMAKNELIKK